jgi:hypothetical protein
MGIPMMGAVADSLLAQLPIAIAEDRREKGGAIGVTSVKDMKNFKPVLE